LVLGAKEEGEVWYQYKFNNKLELAVIRPKTLTT
jgi:hypothetical protein